MAEHSFLGCNHLPTCMPTYSFYVQLLWYTLISSPLGGALCPELTRAFIPSGFRRDAGSLTTGHWPRWSLTTDHWPLTTDNWPLTTDHWPLTTDHWPLWSAVSMKNDFCGRTVWIFVEMVTGYAPEERRGYEEMNQGRVRMLLLVRNSIYMDLKLGIFSLQRSKTSPCISRVDWNNLGCWLSYQVSNVN